MPISALASYHGNDIVFTGLVSSLDGSREVKTEHSAPVTGWKSLGQEAANAIRQSEEGKRILEEFRKLNRHPDARAAH